MVSARRNCLALARFSSISVLVLSTLALPPCCCLPPPPHLSRSIFSPCGTTSRASSLLGRTEAYNHGSYGLDTFSGWLFAFRSLICSPTMSLHPRPRSETCIIVFAVYLFVAKPARPMPCPNRPFYAASSSRDTFTLALQPTLHTSKLSTRTSRQVDGVK